MDSKQDILQLLNEGKIDTRWQQFIAAGDFKTLLVLCGYRSWYLELFMDNCICFMFPNAELALMFIPVPIKANILYPFSIS
jgi:hypothetical protein